RAVACPATGPDTPPVPRRLLGGLGPVVQGACHVPEVRAEHAVGQEGVAEAVHRDLETRPGRLVEAGEPGAAAGAAGHVAAEAVVLGEEEVLGAVAAAVDELRAVVRRGRGE